MFSVLLCVFFPPFSCHCLLFHFPELSFPQTNRKKYLNVQSVNALMKEYMVLQELGAKCQVLEDMQAPKDAPEHFVGPFTACQPLPPADFVETTLYPYSLPDYSSGIS